VFLAGDQMEWRHRKIRSFLPDEPVIAIVLGAVDFEWTVRRAIIALGTNSNRHIRDEVLRTCSGAESYKDAWKKEVKPRLGRTLPEVVPDWNLLKEEGFGLRNRVVHGIRGMPTSRQAVVGVEAFLAASAAISEFAEQHGQTLFGQRLPVRRKPRV
jgi:hypothetical protein